MKKITLYSLLCSCALMSNAVFADGETLHNGNDPDFVNGDYCGHVLTAMTDYYERIANRAPFDVARRK